MMDGLFNSMNPFRLSRKKIVLIAETLTRSYARMHGDTPKNYFTINFDHVYDTLVYPRYGILLEEGDDLGECNGEKILGYYDAFTNTISLDGILNDTSDLISRKKVFTAWHELGHAILHRAWVRTHVGQFSDGRIVTVESAISMEASRKLEQQANLFASHAAAPQWFLDFVIQSTYDLNRPIRYVGPARYWLEVWGCRRMCPICTFAELCMNIAYHIRHRFGGLSIESLSYRVHSSRWVTDVTLPSRPCPTPLFRTAPIHVSSVLASV
jgi:hypothetical protein